MSRPAGRPTAAPFAARLRRDLRRLFRRPRRLPPVVYRTSGGYDADTEVRIDAAGTYTVEGGGYATRGRRRGRLTRRQRAELAALAGALDLRAWPVPAGADGFVHTLRVGDADGRWWGPPADVDSALAAFVGALAALG